MRQGGAYQLYLRPLADVRDNLLQALPQTPCARLFELLVLGGFSVEALPQFVGLVARGVAVDNRLARGSQAGVEHRRDGDDTHVLGCPGGSLGVLGW